MAEENKERYGEEPGEINLLDIFKKFKAHRKKVYMWTAIAAVFGIIAAISIPKQYSSSSKLAPEITQKSNGSMSSLAALAGISTGNMSSADAVYPDLYPEVIKSIPFRIELFSMPVKFMDGDDAVETDLYHFLLDYYKEPWWSHVLSAPGKAINWLVGLVKHRKEPIHGYDQIDQFRLTGEQARVSKRIGDCISVQVDKKINLITVSVMTQNPKVSADLCQLVCDNLQKYVTNYRTEKSRHDLEYYQQLNDQARDEYFAAQQKYARYVDANQGVVFQRVLIERDRLQQEANLKYSVYNTTSQQVQTAKAKVQMETPVYAILQPATVPLVKSLPSTGKILVAFAFMGFLLSAVWYIWGVSLKNKFKKGTEDEEVVDESNNG